MKKIWFGLANLPLMMTNHIIVSFLYFRYYNESANKAILITLVPVASFGIASVIGRIFDGVADPLIGNLSDNARTRWGRRIPFIALGILPMLICFFLIWSPPFAKQNVYTGIEAWINFAFLAAFYSLFFIFYTIVAAPYLALFPEAATNKETRIDYAKWMALFSAIGLLVGGAVPPLIFKNFGFFTMALVFSIFSLVCFIPMLLTTQETKFLSGECKTQDPVGLFQSVKLTISNRAFRIHLINFCLFFLSINLVISNTPFYIQNVLKLNEDYFSIAFGGTMIVAILFFPVISMLAKPSRWGKKKVMIAALISYSIIAGSQAVIPLLSGVSMPLTQVLAIASFFVMGIPISAFNLIFNPIVADITDDDEKKTGKRREGIFFGTQGFFVKLAYGGSIFLLSSLIHPIARKFGNLNSGIMFVGLLAGIFTFIGFLIFRHYPLED